MKFQWKTGLQIVCCVFLLYLAAYYWEAAANLISLLLSSLAPLFIGIAIAYVLNILMSFYERHYFAKHREAKAVKKSRRGVCMVAAMLTLLAIVSLIFGLVLPALGSCISLFIAEVPELIRQLAESDLLSRILPAELLTKLANINWSSYLTKAVQFLASGISSATGVVFTAISSVVSVAVTVFISIVFSIYLLLGKEKLQEQGKRVMHTYLPFKWEKKLLYWLEVLNESFHRFIVGQCTEAVILGVLCAIGMVIFRFPYAGMMGALIGFTALIPIAGAYIGAAVGAVMMLTESPLTALLFVMFIIVLQQLEGNLIYPKVIGKSIGLPALWVLTAITIGGGLFGIVGMLIGVPIVAAIYRLLREDVEKRSLSAIEE